MNHADAHSEKDIQKNDSQHTNTNTHANKKRPLEHGSHILITGATSGIGKQLTTDYLQAGHHVYAVGRDEDALAELEALGATSINVDLMLAEHNMLVDLGRNDLGKISNFSTVEVTEYKMIHKYSRIMHICSQVFSS